MADLFFGGGLNETDPFNISPDECISGENFVLDARRRNYRRRPPQDLKGTATNAGTINGIMQMIKRDDTVTTLVKSDNVIYEWDGADSWTSKSTDHSSSSRYRSVYWSLDELLVITDMDKNDPLYKWDGSSVLRLKTGLVAGSPTAVSQLSRTGSTATATQSTHGYSTGDLITIAGASESEYNGEHEVTVTGANTYTYAVSGTPATPITTTITADLGVELKAKYSAIKDNRVWLFNIKTDSTENPHMILASGFEDPENFDTSIRGKGQDADSVVTSEDPFFLLTPDLKPINGAVFFYDLLIISTVNGRLFKLEGTSPDTYNFVDYYAGSAASGVEAMVNMGNDVIYTKEGSIEKLSDTERSGDVSADDVGQFVQNTIKGLDDPIGVYDQANQRVFWFNTGFILAFDKEISAYTPDVSPWMKWTTGLGNQFETKAVTYLRRPDGTKFSVYWGDSSGRVYDLNGTGFSGDAGTTAIEASRKTRYVAETPSNFSGITGRIQYRRVGSFTLNMTFEWGEEYNSTKNAVSMKGPTFSGTPKFFNEEDVYFNEDDYFNEGTVTGDSTLDNLVSTVGFSAVGHSPGFFLTIAASTTIDFQIDKVMFDGF